MEFRITVIGDVSRVELTGHVDEDAKPAFARIETAVTTPRAVFDVGGIGKINSVGIKSWILAFDRYDKLFTSSYERCTMAFVDVAMMVPSFTKKRPILSFHTAMSCDVCRIDVPVLVELVSGVGSPPLPQPCVRCGAGMVVDEDIEADLEFLRRRVGG